MRQMRVWETVDGRVYIKQKVIRRTPTEKRLEGFINILAGGHGTMAVNTRVRPGAALQRALGRDGCADQSVVSDTFNACTEEDVEQMLEAM